MSSGWLAAASSDFAVCCWWMDARLHSHQATSSMAAAVPAYTPGRPGPAWPLTVQVWLENEHVRLMVLPQLGGRIHVLQVRLQLLACLREVREFSMVGNPA